MSDSEKEALDVLYENFLHDCMEFKWDLVDSRVAVKQMKMIRDVLKEAYEIGRKDGAAGSVLRLLKEHLEGKS